MLLPIPLSYRNNAAWQTVTKTNVFNHYLLHSWDRGSAGNSSVLCWMYLCLSAQLASHRWLTLLSSLTCLELGLGSRGWWNSPSSGLACACHIAQAGVQEGRKISKAPLEVETQNWQCYLHWILLAKINYKATSKKE